RYVDIEDERNAPRSVYSLADAAPLDAFALRREYEFLAPLVDASYGSGTFIAADHPTTLEVRVSTTGLLVRERRGAVSPSQGGKRRVLVARHWRGSPSPCQHTSNT